MRSGGMDFLAAQFHAGPATVGNGRLTEFLPDSAQAHEEREREKQQQPTWFAPWPDVEREAIAIRCFEPCIIPGLVQTKEYMQASIGTALLSPEQVERYSARRLARQTAVFDRENPPVCQFIVDEGALRRGAPDLIRDQLLHLVDLGGRRTSLSRWCLSRPGCI